jgi:hypothetical protein
MRVSMAEMLRALKKELRYGCLKSALINSRVNMAVEECYSLTSPA